MNFKQAIAATALTATLGMAIPAAPALADGAASTRNILLGVGAATYLIIQHNRKVHERYAEDARKQAYLQQENNDAWAAYHQEQRAYDQQVAVNADLKREIAYQHKVVEQQRQQLAANGSRGSFAQRQNVQHTVARSNARNDKQVALVSYGWGDL